MHLTKFKLKKEKIITGVAVEKAAMSLSAMALTKAQVLFRKNLQQKKMWKFICVDVRRLKMFLTAMEVTNKKNF